MIWNESSSVVLLQKITISLHRIKDVLFLPDFSHVFILLSYSLKNYIALKSNDR